jgi:hypothetical protein
VLPNPDFGDIDADLNEMKLERSMMGGVYTYIKTKSEKLLTYNFRLHRSKYYELEAFYENTIAQPIQLDNWKGETWVGYIINDVLDNTEKRKYDNEVTIEFEGIKVAG